MQPPSVDQFGELAAWFEPEIGGVSQARRVKADYGDV